MAGIITKPEAGDFEKWSAIWRQQNEHHKLNVPESQYGNAFKRIIEEGGDVYCLVIQDPKTAEFKGLAHYTLTRSPRSEQPSCHMTDLFVAESERGKGYGRMLIEAVTAAAKELKCRRVTWVSRADNVSARLLYDKMGSAEDVFYRINLNGDA